MSAIVPPIKCQGIKTKLIPAIRAMVPTELEGRWVEPFCGSGVVAFNLQPRYALLTDTNRHIIRFYQSLQTGDITPGTVARFLEEEGAKLAQKGEEHYYAIRERFNAEADSLDFLFLNRACFNGVMRFNRKGGFNTPFCRKPNRFMPAYITKIVNQVRAVQQIITQNSWRFEVADFQQTLASLKPTDMVYADPPYLGRHTDYYNAWTEKNEADLIEQLHQLPCTFLLSTWEENEFRRNSAMDQHWNRPNYHHISIQHFYHVGASEDLRHSMTEALITNRQHSAVYIPSEKPLQYALDIA